MAEDKHEFSFNWKRIDIGGKVQLGISSPLVFMQLKF